MTTHTVLCLMKMVLHKVLNSSNPPPHTLTYTHVLATYLWYWNFIECKRLHVISNNTVVPPYMFLSASYHCFIPHTPFVVILNIHVMLFIIGTILLVWQLLLAVVVVYLSTHPHQRHTHNCICISVNRLCVLSFCSKCWIAANVLNKWQWFDL